MYFVVIMAIIILYVVLCCLRCSMHGALITAEDRLFSKSSVFKVCRL